MSERFYVATPIVGQHSVITGDETRHLATVMRLTVGDDVMLFDGSGAEFSARITAVGKQAVQLDIVERLEVSRELPFTLTLAVALPKGDRQKWLVEKTTELGVTCLVPLITERGVALPVESALDRLRRSVIEASKQCGRNRLMEIAEPRQAGDLFGDSSVADIRIVAHPSGQPIDAIPRQSIANLIAAIGPEGGFSEAEIAAAVAGGWQVVSLGSRILRVETAAIAIAAWAGMTGN